MIQPYFNRLTQDIVIPAGMTFVLTVVFRHLGLPVDQTGRTFVFRVRDENGDRFEAIAVGNGDRVRFRVPGTSTIELFDPGLMYDMAGLIHDGMGWQLQGRFTAYPSGRLVVADADDEAGAEEIEITIDPPEAVVIVDFRGPGLSEAILDELVRRPAFDLLQAGVEERFVEVDQRIDQFADGGKTVFVGTLTQMFALPPASNVGRTAFVTNFGIGGSMWASNGISWNPMSGITPISRTAFTADTGPSTTVVGTETALLSVPIPGLVMGETRALDIVALCRVTAPPTAKTVRIRHNGSATNVAAGPIHYIEDTAEAGVQTLWAHATIVNVTATEQISVPSDISSSGGWSLKTPSAEAHLGNVDTTKTHYVHLTAQLGGTGKISLVHSMVALRA